MSNESLIYITVWDFSNEKTNGICKKIRTQINSFKHHGYDVDYTYVANGKTFFVNEGKIQCLGRNGKLGKLRAFYLMYNQIKKNHYANAYIRYALADFYFIRLLKLLKNKGIKIVVEMPTFPYELENTQNVFDNINFILDKIFRNKLKEYVHRIATFSKHSEIYGIKTISVQNGIEVENIVPRKIKEKIGEIHLLAVGQMAFWHGWDRLILGMADYYRWGNERKVVLHLVGDGEKVLLGYKELVKREHLEEYVIFHGEKFGPDLDEIYNCVDIGVESLGWHRMNVSISSSLKSREYAAKGLPIITASELDIFPADKYDFILKYPADDTNIDVGKIVHFYDMLYNNDWNKMLERSETIREVAKQVCDINITLLPIINFFENRG